MAGDVNADRATGKLLLVFRATVMPPLTLRAEGVAMIASMVTTTASWVSR